MVLRRDQLLVITSLALIIALSWAYILTGAGVNMAAISGSDKMSGVMLARPTWDAGYAALMLFMWWVMMLAMMLPSAAPTILLFMAINDRSEDGSRLAGAAFVLGYAVVWAGFSAAATILQWSLEKAALLTLAMASSSLLLGGGLLIAAGIWQLTPLKHACLRHCRSPIHFLAHGWREGTNGAFRMGLEHGAFCLGCCWVLMTLLFYGGVMNLWWIAGLAIYVLIEKLVPAGHWIGRGVGVLLVVWGLIVIATAA